MRLARLRGTTITGLVATGQNDPTVFKEVDLLCDYAARIADEMVKREAERAERGAEATE